MHVALPYGLQFPAVGEAGNKRAWDVSQSRPIAGLDQLRQHDGRSDGPYVKLYIGPYRGDCF